MKLLECHSSICQGWLFSGLNYLENTVFWSYLFDLKSWELKFVKRIFSSWIFFLNMTFWRSNFHSLTSQCLSYMVKTVESWTFWSYSYQSWAFYSQKIFKKKLLGRHAVVLHSLKITGIFESYICLFFILFFFNEF